MMIDLCVDFLKKIFFLLQKCYLRVEENTSLSCLRSSFARGPHSASSRSYATIRDPNAAACWAVESATTWGEERCEPVKYSCVVWNRYRGIVDRLWIESDRLLAADSGLFWAGGVCRNSGLQIIGSPTNKWQNGDVSILSKKTTLFALGKNLVQTAVQMWRVISWNLSIQLSSIEILLSNLDGGMRNERTAGIIFWRDRYITLSFLCSPWFLPTKRYFIRSLI